MQRRPSENLDAAGQQHKCLSMKFGAFAEEQWKTLVPPTLKLSTQHRYKTVRSKHLLPYCEVPAKRAE
jgi:hypothetical protein